MRKESILGGCEVCCNISIGPSRQSISMIHKLKKNLVPVDSWLFFFLFFYYYVIYDSAIVWYNLVTLLFRIIIIGTGATLSHVEHGNNNIDRLETRLLIYNILLDIT